MDGQMNIIISQDKNQMGMEAAKRGAERIRQAIAADGNAVIILATGMSQFTVLEVLVKEPDIDWSVVTVFHLDEYIGIEPSHPASFRKYLRERFEERVPKLAAFHYVLGDAPDPEGECRRLSGLIEPHSIAVAYIGIGENGHIAFNDPPADFETEKPFIVVELDDACRNQQLGEGWFPTFDDVPKKAISMSIHRIMKSRCLIVSVPDERKARAVKCTVEGPVTPECPGSILQQHDDCYLYLDNEAASLLTMMDQD
jgi:glucosamine-6-phosphate deaminase